MPSSDTAKTASEHRGGPLFRLFRQRLWWIGLAGLLVVGGVVTAAAIMPSASRPVITARLPDSARYQLTLAVQPEGYKEKTYSDFAQPDYNVAIARSAREQSIGLGNLDSMPADHGMLFWYTTTANRCFWMKDMRFPIDIIWLSSSRHVVHIEQSVSPATYPQVFCATAQYVVELHAGEAAKQHLRIGQTVRF